MYVAASQKQQKSIVVIGKTNMSAGNGACYQLMQICQAEYFRQLLKPVT